MATWIRNNRPELHLTFTQILFDHGFYPNIPGPSGFRVEAASNGALVRWANDPWHTNYQVQVSSSGGFTTGVTTLSPSNSATSLSTFFLGTRYFRIRARDSRYGNGWTRWTYSGSVTVGGDTEPL